MTFVQSAKTNTDRGYEKTTVVRIKRSQDGHVKLIENYYFKLAVSCLSAQAKDELIMELL